MEKNQFKNENPLIKLKGFQKNYIPKRTFSVTLGPTSPYLSKFQHFSVVSP
jgi:hypothetical protein